MAPSRLAVGVRRPATLTELLRASAGPVGIDLEAASGRAGRLDEALAAGRAVYGYSTGFGALASHAAHDDDRQHQLALVHHLATGTGDPLPPRAARALVFDRLVTLSRGHSAASDDLLRALAVVLATDGAPAIPRYGSVGASGDLTPLAHLAMVLAGDGTWLNPDGSPADPRPDGLQRYEFSRRDALALVNGTSASNALASLAFWDLAMLIPIAFESMALMVRSMDLAEEAMAEPIHRLRGQPGQVAVADVLRERLAQAPVARDDGTGAGGHHASHERSIQAAYSFRCIPQILGPTVEAVRAVAATLERELNAVTDNPVFDEPGTVYHGGNFHGQYVAEASDRLAFAAATTAGLMERQIARVTDPLLNHGLPPFLTGAAAGGHSGFMGLQVSATALTAEISASAQRRYALESRSTNGANQDVVSMSTLAALALYETIPRLRELTAMHAIVAVQAAELAGLVGEDAPLQKAVRTVSPALNGDRPLSAEIRDVADDLAGLTGAQKSPRHRDQCHAYRGLVGASWNALFPDRPFPDLSS